MEKPQSILRWFLVILSISFTNPTQPYQKNNLQDNYCQGCIVGNDNRFEVRYEVNEELIEYLKKSEGFVPTVYDSGGKTIGYGHLIKKNESFDTISEREADLLLRKDFYLHSQFAEKNLAFLNKSQREAVSLFIFALGEGNFKKSSLYRKLINKQPILEEDFTKWSLFKNKPNSNLSKRRQYEYRKFIGQ